MTPAELKTLIESDAEAAAIRFGTTCLPVYAFRVHQAHD